MKNIDVVISVISWEDRFICGLELLFKQRQPRVALFFRYNSYAKEYAVNLEAARSLCKAHAIQYVEAVLDFFTPKQNWLTIRDTVSSVVKPKDKVTFDISTSPRETIWSTLFFLQHAKAEIEYVYHRPKHHNDDWLTRDPGEPRLLYKMSGICELGKPTLLFVFPGYDYLRVSNLINFFEPSKLIIAAQDDGNKKNDAIVSKCIGDNDGNMVVEKIETNLFNDDHCYSIIAEKVEENLRHYNIVFSSLGVKLSAISLYKINREFPETALCYIPCKEFNTHYSEGILELESEIRTLEIPKRKYDLLFDY